jgi:CoA:oxalate CoA-transferase
MTAEAHGTSANGAASRTVGPLTGIRVVDLGQNITGPVAALMLRALGADVIKVEVPARGENSRHSPPYLGRSGGLSYQNADGSGIAASYLKRNRGKRGMTLDLKSAGGAEVFERLVKSADIMIENFRPGALDRLGFGFDRLHQFNPGLTLCSISGFGDGPPYSSWLAYDGIVQAFSGVLERTGYPDGKPVKSGFPVADNLGALFGVIGIMAALRERDRLGTGSHVKVSMVDAVLFMLWDDPLDYFEQQGLPPRSGNGNRRVAPWTMFDAADGYVFICAHTDRQWTQLARILELDDSEGRFATVGERVAREPEVNAIVGNWTATRNKEEIARQLQDAGVPCAPVRRPAEVARDSAFASSFRPLKHPDFDGSPEALTAQFPLRFYPSDQFLDESAPALGRDNDTILTELGYSQQQIDEMSTKGEI